MTFDSILLVDDSEPDNVFHEILLRKAGFTGSLHVYEDARAALADLPRLASEGRALVLLDLNMPGMDGWQFIEAAADWVVRQPAVVLVMLTSSPATEDRDRARSLSTLQGFMTKPLTIESTRALLQGRWPRL